MYPVFGSTGYPTCTQLGLSSPDNSWDCLVYVTFNPTQPGLRTGQLVATTANGSVYNFQLTGTGTGGQLAIDGGQQQAVAFCGRPGHHLVHRYDLNGHRLHCGPDEQPNRG